MNEGSETQELHGRVFALVMGALPSGSDRDTITGETNLRLGLGLDSLAMASFLFRCGEGLGVDPNDLIELLAEAPIQTIGDVVALGVRVSSQASAGAVPGAPPRAP